MGKPSADAVSKDDLGREDHPSPSSAAAHPLLNYEYTDADTSQDALPAYTDLPDLPRGLEIAPHHPPPLPSSSVSSDSTTISTQHAYDAASLEEMVREQSRYPPIYTMRLHGTHTETHRRHDDKTEKKNVTDFDIRIDLTHLVVSDASYIECIPGAQKGYRGTVFQGLAPHVAADAEAGSALEAWCRDYASHGAALKTFTLTRSVRGHDTGLLTSLARHLIDETAYRGHVSITFPTEGDTIVVYAPGRVTALRFNAYVRWFFYLTFLWVVAWPALFLATRKWEVVRAVFPYRREGAGGAGGAGAPVVQSEHMFWEAWRGAARRAVLARRIGWVDEAYRAETSRMVAAGELAMGEAADARLVEGAVRGVLGVATGGWPVQMGWGADS